jgi:hypothetical protein
MKTLRYCVVQELDLQRFQDKVNALIGEGWSVNGTMIVGDSAIRDQPGVGGGATFIEQVYMQTLVRNPPNTYGLVSAIAWSTDGEVRDFEGQPFPRDFDGLQVIAKKMLGLGE